MDTEEGYKIEVRGARGLMPMDPNGQSDPYCKIGVANPTTNDFIDPSSVARSKTHFVTLNPVWKGFSCIVKESEKKVRIEVWDKDQDEVDDFEGLSIIDVSTLGGNSDVWLPLTGRTDDEKVTGDVNIVVTKGPLHELEKRGRSNSIKDPSQEVERLAALKKEDESMIKRLQADLKTKTGKLEQLNEKYNVLDGQFVRAKQSVEVGQAELVAKSGLLAAQAEALAKATSQVAELEKALQEKQGVSQLVKEWNDNAQMLNQLQAHLKAKSSQHRKPQQGKLAQSSETTVISEKEIEWLSVGKVMEQMMEYTSLVAVLETDLKEKTEQIEKDKVDHARLLSKASEQIESLQLELATKREEIEKQQAIHLGETQLLQESIQEIENLKADLNDKVEQMERKREVEQQLENANFKIEELSEELRIKAEELNLQTRKLETFKVDIIAEMKVNLKQKEDELEELKTMKIELDKQNHTHIQQINEITIELATKSRQIEKMKVELEEKEEVTLQRVKEVERLREEMKDKDMKVELLSTVEHEHTSETAALRKRNEELQADKVLLEGKIEQLSRHVSRGAEDFARLEADLKQTQELLRVERESKDNSDEFAMVSVKTKKKEQEVETRDAGMAQFSAKRPVAKEEEKKQEEETAQPTKFEESEGSESSRDLLGVQLEELERLEAAGRASTVPLLESSLPALPRSHEVARAKKKRFCC